MSQRPVSRQFNPPSLGKKEIKMCEVVVWFFSGRDLVLVSTKQKRMLAGLHHIILLWDRMFVACGESQGLCLL